MHHLSWVKTIIAYALNPSHFSLAGADTPAAAYHILPEKRVDRIGGQMMASTHIYDLSVSVCRNCVSPLCDIKAMHPYFQKKVGVSDGGVEVSLDPDAIDLDQGKLQEKYDEQLRKQVIHLGFRH